MEQTVSKGNSITLDSTVKRNYTNLFPSVFINHTFNENNVMSLSYSRRINRPDYQKLNPFISFINLYSYDQGNPFLQPVLDNSFEVEYVYKGNFILSAGYEREKGSISKIPEVVDPSKDVVRRILRLTAISLNLYHLLFHSYLDQRC